MISLDKRTAGLLFVSLVAATYATAVALRGLLGELPRGEVVEAALTVDLCLMVPLYYHLFLVRPRGWPPLSTAPIFLLGLGAAALALPPGHRGGVELMSTLAIPVELFLIAYVGYRAWKGITAFRTAERGTGTETAQNGTDHLEQLRVAASEAVGVRRAADILAYEVAIFYYALFSWRRGRGPRSRTGAERNARLEPEVSTFSYHRVGSYGVVLVGLLVAVVAELVVVHVLLYRFGLPTAAWALTALSLYGFLWLLGDYRAMRLRPHSVGPGGIDIRSGLRWTVAIPFDRVRRVERLTWRSVSHPGRGSLDVSILSSPQFRIELDGPVEARGLYGIRKSAGALTLAVDEPDRFAEALRRCSPRTVLEPDER